MNAMEDTNPLTEGHTQSHGSTPGAGPPRGRRSLRPPDPALEPQDAPVHLRRALRDPHHRPPEDPAADREGAEAAARTWCSRATTSSSSAPSSSSRRWCRPTRRARGCMYVTERWLGGTLTNFPTIKKQIRRLRELEQGSTEGDFENYTKKEQLLFERERVKLSRNLEGMKNMSRLPGRAVHRRRQEGADRGPGGQQARHSGRRDRRHQRRSRRHHGADCRQRRRDPLGGADHQGALRRDQGSPRAGAGRAKPPSTTTRRPTAPTAAARAIPRPSGGAAGPARASGGRSPRPSRRG